MSTPAETPPPPARLLDAFERIYATELVYRKDCWQLCGDAHCCSFTRYKSQFRLMRSHAQELPLLPGEYEFLERQGWLAQFGDFDHKVSTYEAGSYLFRAESIVSRRPGGCVCDHGTRTTICRLYPLLPVFRWNQSNQITLAGVERAGIYEDLEHIAGLQPACKLETLPFDQLARFLEITEALARNPEHLLYLEAYRITKAHVAERVADRQAKAKTPNPNVFHSFESGLLRQQLIDDAVLKPALETLAADFATRFGDCSQPRLPAASTGSKATGQTES